MQLRAGSARSWHFAHLPGFCADGEHEAEGWQHRAIKRQVLIAARSLGWAAREEHRRVDGRWIADVLLEHDQHRIAVEVQWSPQTLEAYRARTDRYADDGIRTVWLHRSRTIAGILEDELEHRRVGVRGNEAEHHCYVVDAVRALRVSEFVKRLLDGRLRETTVGGQANSGEPEWNFPTALAHAIARGGAVPGDLSVPPGMRASDDRG